MDSAIFKGPLLLRAHHLFPLNLTIEFDISRYIHINQDLRGNGWKERKKARPLWMVADVAMRQEYAKHF